MTDLPEQLPDARAVLVAAYQMSLAADMAHVEWQQTGDESPFVNAQHGREQAQALAAIGAGLATIEAAELTRVDFIEMADQGRRLAAVERQIPADLGHPRGAAAGDTVALMVAAARIVEQWQALPYTSRHQVLAVSPALVETLNGAADLLGMTDADRATEQVQPLPPVDNVAGCGATDLGRRCVRLADHEDGHLFPPTVPAGPDRFA